MVSYRIEPTSGHLTPVDALHPAPVLFHASVDVKNGFILATKMTPASIHDTNYLPYLTLASCHTEDAIKKVYADKGYYGEPNRSFLHLNEIEDGLRLVEASLRLGENYAQGY